MTRDGENVRIVCTDVKDELYPILALVENRNKEIPIRYTKDGKFISNDEYPCDLFFALEKKEGWVKVYYGKSRCNTFVCNRIFATKEEAEKQKNDDVVAIIKIEWEE